MKVKKLKKALKEVPDDADVMILTYGYSQGRKELFDIEEVKEDMDMYRLIIVAYE